MNLHTEPNAPIEEPPTEEPTEPTEETPPQPKGDDEDGD